MRIQYDVGTDSLTITLSDKQIRESDEIRPGVIADFGPNGAVVRLEILNASTVVDNAREMQFAVGA
ncbi:MAG: DUF2283 domain-containing protein [Proteobacteria bacterium]|jgi:uncharacterized protein YuzE|nr:DUF2283 domain-containing protein [Pseudomonadota bacterium]